MPIYREVYLERTNLSPSSRTAKTSSARRQTTKKRSLADFDDV
jgi:hypothetical protein